MRRVVLASASPRRRELLTALIPEFEVRASDADETLTGDPTADAERLALAKAKAIAADSPGAIVIGADTIVFDSDRSYGKPADPADARAMWAALGGREHSVVTGVALVGPDGEQVTSQVSTVRLANFDAAAVDAYIASGSPMDKAGAYAIQDAEFAPVVSFEGCFCSIMGLPLWRLAGALEAAGAETSSPSGAFDRCLECVDRPKGT